MAKFKRRVVSAYRLVLLLAGWLLLLDHDVQAQECFPGATFPKMIGYGLQDTEVVSIDRRASDEALVFAAYTTESNLVGGLASSNVLSVMLYLPASDTYSWYKVIDDVDTSRLAFIYFSPDGSRVLALYFMNS